MLCCLCISAYQRNSSGQTKLTAARWRIWTSSQYVTRLRLRRLCRCASKWLIKTFLHITSISTLNLMRKIKTNLPDQTGDQTSTDETSFSCSRNASNDNNNNVINNNSNTSRNMLLTEHSGSELLFMQFKLMFLFINYA